MAGTNYRIVNRNSGKPPVVSGGSADGAPVLQQTGGANQQWQLIPAQ